MGLAILSDIHGNVSALETVLEKVGAAGITDIICLGDTAGYYSNINACIDLLRERNIPSLMGNHDHYLASGTPCDRSNSANRCLDYQRSILRPDNLEWLQNLPHTLSHCGVEFVHAGWQDHLEEYIVPSDDYFQNQKGQNFASGHTHVQYVWKGLGKTYCNPGSVGQPRDGDPHAAFAIWDGTTFTLQRTAYDISRTEQDMIAAGFSEHFYINLRQGSRIGGQIDSVPC